VPGRPSSIASSLLLKTSSLSLRRSLSDCGNSRVPIDSLARNDNRGHWRFHPTSGWSAANELMVVITRPAPPGVVIQLDGHDATRLAMTRMGSLAFPSKRSGLVCRLAMTVQIAHSESRAGQGVTPKVFGLLSPTYTVGSVIEPCTADDLRVVGRKSPSDGRPKLPGAPRLVRDDSPYRQSGDAPGAAPRQRLRLKPKTI